MNKEERKNKIDSLISAAIDFARLPLQGNKKVVYSKRNNYGRQYKIEETFKRKEIEKRLKQAKSELMRAMR